MIRYALCCDEGHRFDSWFYDSAAFDEQAGRGLVTCPTCDSRHVVKAIMAPAVVAKRGRGLPEAAEPPAGARPAAPPPDQQTAMTLVDQDRRQMVRAIRDKVFAESRDVGRAFATEARRIHDDASEERIRGQATLDEARNLLEDGIMVLPVPVIPDDLN